MGNVAGTSFRSGTERFAPELDRTGPFLGPGAYDDLERNRTLQDRRPPAHRFDSGTSGSRLSALEAELGTALQTPGPGAYLFEREQQRKSGRQSSPWAASGVNRLEDIIGSHTSAPGQYDAKDMGRPTIAQSSSRANSPNMRSQNGSATFGSSSERTCESVAASSSAATPGPGYYSVESSDRKLRVSNLSGSSFRSGTPQREAAAAWRAPPPGAYETESAAGSTSVHVGNVAGTSFRSGTKRFTDPVKPTADNLGPGAYTPEAGLKAAASRQGAAGCQGAQSYPFSSSSLRSLSLSATHMIQ